MGILNRLFSQSSDQSDYSAVHELKAIWDSYSDQWPDNNDKYKSWKPDSLLPAPKWAIKRAMKLFYGEWPEPIDWTIFSAFSAEFSDLALHLSEEKYDTIQNFRKQRIMCCGNVKKNDPLLMYRLSSSEAVTYSPEQCDEAIVYIRDGLQRSKAWDPVDVSDHELDTVRNILLEATTEFYTLIQEWRFYILSIGRDHYIR